MSAKFDHIREWRPGDGITCSRARQAPPSTPCGPPVAVYRSPVASFGPGRGEGSRSYVVCAGHLPLGDAPGVISAAAHKAAAEQLIVEHWDEYQRLIQEHIEREMSAKREALPESLRHLVHADTETSAA